jgi:hypothetical protein
LLARDPTTFVRLLKPESIGKEFESVEIEA